MIKITFMGAGSTVFARNVLGDCMCTPALRESEIALYDIDEKRLEDSRIILSAINHNVNEDRAVIKTYLGAENRKDALRDADFVVNAIQVGGYEPCTVTDFEIPKKYGIKQTIAPPAYTRATAMRDPSCICNLHHSSWQHRILNPLSKARDRTCNLMVPSPIR